MPEPKIRNRLLVFELKDNQVNTGISLTSTIRNYHSLFVSSIVLLCIEISWKIAFYLEF